MGRSVFVPNDALAVVYTLTSAVEDDYDADLDAWNGEVGEVVAALQGRFRSLYPPDRRTHVGREGVVKLQNDLVRIGLSEYSGLVAWWVIARYDDVEALATKFTEHVESELQRAVSLIYGERLEFVARASNGEVAYRRL